MASAYRHRLIAALGLTLLACDPGYTVDVRIVVPDAVASAYTPAQRGLLLAQISPAEHETELYAITVVCGEGGSFTSGTACARAVTSAVATRATAIIPPSMRRIMSSIVIEFVASVMDAGMPPVSDRAAT